jgi:hypothetical protein
VQCLISWISSSYLLLFENARERRLRTGASQHKVNDSLLPIGLVVYSRFSSSPQQEGRGGDGRLGI